MEVYYDGVIQNNEQHNHTIDHHGRRMVRGVTGVGLHLQHGRELGIRSSDHKTTPKGSNPLPLHLLIVIVKSCRALCAGYPSNLDDLIA